LLSCLHFGFDTVLDVFVSASTVFNVGEGDHGPASAGNVKLGHFDRVLSFSDTERDEQEGGDHKSQMHECLVLGCYRLLRACENLIDQRTLSLGGETGSSSSDAGCGTETG
jgi:hypothetical protein